MKNKGVLLFIILLTAGFIGVVSNLYLDTIEAPVEVELAKPDSRHRQKGRGHWRHHTAS